MLAPEPFRGQVWDIDFEFGGHPAVILSVNALNSRLGHVAVVPITGSAGPAATHVVLDAGAGLTRYDVSYADVTSMRPVSRDRLLQLRGLVAPNEMGEIEERLRVYLGL